MVSKSNVHRFHVVAARLAPTAPTTALAANTCGFAIVRTFPVLDIDCDLLADRFLRRHDGV